MNALRVVVAGSALFLAGSAVLGQGDDSLMPSTLTESQRASLKKYLAGVEKPTRFIPEKAKVVGAGSVELDPDPLPGATIKEYLAAIIPQTISDPKKSPEKAYVYWYRPNPKKGLPGVTIRRTVDLRTGERVGEPEVLVNHATPLAREELPEAIQLARQQIPLIRELYAAAADEKAIAVTPLVQVISASEQPEGAPGDRVVSLQFRVKNSTRRVTIMVNLTQQTARDANAP